MEVVYVRWLDARGLGGSVSLAVAKSQHPLVMHTAGILVDEDEERVVISQDRWSFTEDGQEVERVRDLEVTPRVLIQSLQRFTVRQSDEKALAPTAPDAPLPSFYGEKTYT